MRACRTHMPNVIPTDGFVCVVNVLVVFVAIINELRSYLRFSKIWDKTQDTDGGVYRVASQLKMFLKLILLCLFGCY